LLLSALALATTKRPYRWVVLTGLAIGLFFHAGNAQMWAYGVLAWGLVIGFDWLAGRIPWRRLLWALAAVVFGLGVAAPLLVPQFGFVSRLAREAAAGNGIWNALGALVLPYPLVQVGHPNGWGVADAPMSPLYYSGSLLTLAGLTAVAVALAHLLRASPDRQFWAGQRWVILAVLAAWLAIGEAGGLWTWLGALPVFRHFTHPFKLLPYLVLFLNVAGALALARVLPARGLAPSLVAGVVAILVLLNAGLARNAFSLFADDPYRSLPDEIAKALQPAAEVPSGRVASAMTVPPGAAGYTASLDYNLATRHGVVSADGYGSMVYFSPENRHLLSRLRADPEAARRAYGIRWRLGAESPTTGRATPIAAVFRAGFEDAAGLAEGGGMVLYDLGPADPMAFFAEAPTLPLAVRIKGTEVVVDLPESRQARGIVLNFLHRPGTVLEAAGAPLDTTADAWGRITAEVAPGVAVLRLGYDGGWGRGLYFGIVLVLMATAIMVVAVARDPSFAGRRHPEKESP
jgi:hypothetical protein